MRRKKLLLVGLLLLTLTVLAPAAVASGGGNSTGLVGEDAHYYEMVPGDYVGGTGTLYKLATMAGWDVFFVSNAGAGGGTFEMEIEDCCIMGDTMFAIAIGAGGVQRDFGTSPGALTLGPVNVPPGGWKLVLVGYLQCPGGFPAGYYWDIWM
jgi:hypothetical protein